MSGTDEARPIEIDADRSTPVGPGRSSSFDATTLDFGHHASRSLEDLARIDPDYLHWLARHPSGARYRAEIQRVLAGAVPQAGDWQR